MFDRNDSMFADVAARFGVREAAVEAFVLPFLWAGEKALGRGNPQEAARRVVKRTLGALQPGGDFARHIAELSTPPSKAATLAICTAAHRLCLWIRAHDVDDDEALANYFETALGYYVDFWRQRPAEEVTSALTAFESKTTRSRAPRGRGGRKSSTTAATTAATAATAAAATAPQQAATAGSGSGATATTRRSSASASAALLAKGRPGAAAQAASDRSSAPGHGSSGGTADEGDSAAPANEPRAQTQAKGAARTKRSGEGAGASSGGKSRPAVAAAAVQSPPPPGVDGSTRFASSLDVDLRMAAQRAQPRVIEGKRVEIVSHRRDLRPSGGGCARWIVLGKGRAITEPPRVAATGANAAESGASAHALALGARAEDADAVPAAGGGTPATAVSRPSARPDSGVATAAHLFRNAAELLDDDTDESGWWTRRYDALDPAFDSDFEPEHSEGDPNSDVDDDNLAGEESGGVTAGEAAAAAADLSDDDDDDDGGGRESEGQGNNDGNESDNDDEEEDDEDDDDDDEESVVDDGSADASSSDT